MERLTKFFMNRRTLFWSLMVILAIAGVASFMLMPKLEDPAVKGKQATVVVPYPGANAYDVELNVAKLVEDQLYTLPDVNNINTTCKEGVAMFQVEFKKKVTEEEIEQYFDLLRRKVNDIASSLPNGTYAPIVIDDMMDVYGIMYALTGDGYDYEEMLRYAKMLRNRLLEVDGIKRVNIAGSRSEVINIQIDQDRLAANGMLPTQLMMSLQNFGKVVSAGKYEVDNGFYTMRVSGTDNTVEEIRNMLISTPQGKVVKLKDLVQSVSLDYAEPQTNGFFLDGELALALCVAMEGDAVVPDVGKAVEAKMAQVMENVPAGLELHKIFFQPDLVSSSVNGFLLNVAESVLIVIIVLVLFMGWRSGVTIGFGLIMTILISFPILMLWGTTLQRISLGAFIVAMGMLVDNAVVVMDGIIVDRKRGLPASDYLYRTVRNTAMPLLGATIIAICTFIGVYLAEGSTAEYAADLFRVICISLLVSWLLAIVQIPVCTASWFPSHDKSRKSKVESQKQEPSRFAVAVRKVLNTLISHKAVSITVAVLVLVVSALGFTKIKNVFFPDFEYNQVVMECFWPEATSADVVKKNLMEMTRTLQQNEKVTRVSASQGSAPAHYSLVRPMTSGGSCYGELMVDFHNYDELCEELDGIREQLRTAYPDAYIRTRKYNFTVKTSHDIEAEFSGPDPAVLRRLAEQAEQIMRECEYVDPYSVQNNWGTKQPKLQACFNEQSGSNANIGRSNVANALAAATTGMPIGIVQNYDENRIVYLNVRQSDGSKIQDLTNIPVWSMINVRPDPISIPAIMAGGLESVTANIFRTVPISSVCDSLQVVFDDQVVRRHNGKRCIEAECDPNPYNPDATVNKVLAEIQPKIAAIPLPDGYSLDWIGTKKSADEGIMQVLVYTIIGLVIVLLVLLLLFNSWKKLLMIVFCLPFIICGIVPTMLLTDKPFTFMALIGILGLLGMMIKNAIVLVDEIDRLQSEGVAPLEAVIQAVISRTRPVLMASLTTIVGMLPLVADPMFGSMAVAIMGGLAIGTLVTLLLLPLLYATFFRINAKSENEKMRKSFVHRTSSLGTLLLLALCSLFFVPLSASAQTDTLTLSLQDCRDRALNYSQDMQIQRNKAEQADLTRRATLTNFFPNIEGTAMGIYTPDMHLIDNESSAFYVDVLMRGTYMAGFNLTQPVFAGGKLVNGYKLTKVGKEVSAEQQRMARAQVIAEVDNTYWTLVAVLSKVKLLNEYANQLDTLIDQISAANAVGMATDYDLMRVRTARSNIDYQQRRTRNGADMCRLSLCQQIGFNPDSAIILPDTNLTSHSTSGLTSHSASGLSDDLSDRPEIRMMELQLKAQKLQKKMVVGDYLPTVGLMASYSWFGNMKINGGIDMDLSPYGQAISQIGAALAAQGVTIPSIPNPLQRDFSYKIETHRPMLMISVSVPLTKWSEGAFKIKKAKLDVQNTELEMQKNTELMRLEVQKAIRNLDESEGLIESADIALQAATEQLRVMRDRYEVHLIPLSDLLDAQNQWQQAESDYIEARTQQLIYYTDYLRVTGKL